MYSNQGGPQQTLLDARHAQELINDCAVLNGYILFLYPPLIFFLRFI